jgi:hypothetical protein
MGSKVGGLLSYLWLGLLGRLIDLSQDYYQHRKTKTNIHALRGIRTHDANVRAIKAHASNPAVTVG